MAFGDEEECVVKLPTKSPVSVLKKWSAYGSYPLEYFLTERNDSLEWSLQHRSYAKFQKTSTRPSVYSNDDCLYRSSNQMANSDLLKDDFSRSRGMNIAWRSWSQEHFHLPKFNSDDAHSLPKTLLPSGRHKRRSSLARRVSFSETVDEMILPPKAGTLGDDLDDYVCDEMEEDPGFIDNLGSVCFNVLVAIGSFLSPHYPSKKLKSWLY
jgi:hypothetical protein